MYPFEQDTALLRQLSLAPHETSPDQNGWPAPFSAGTSGLEVPLPPAVYSDVSHAALSGSYMENS